MKIIIALLVFFVFSLSLTAQVSDENRRLEHSIYFKQFIQKLGINFDFNRIDGTTQDALRKGISEKGVLSLLTDSKSAADEYSGHPYFLVRENATAVVIGRMYAIENSAVLLEIYLFNDSRSGPIRIAFMHTTVCSQRGLVRTGEIGDRSSR